MHQEHGANYQNILHFKLNSITNHGYSILCDSKNYNIYLSRKMMLTHCKRNQIQRYVSSFSLYFFISDCNYKRLFLPLAIQNMNNHSLSLQHSKYLPSMI